MAKLRREHVMIAREMIARDASIRDVAGKLGVDESTLRYRLKRPLEAPDGRRDRGTALDGWDPVVTAVLERFGDARVQAGGPARCPARVVFDVLVREFGFTGSYQAVRRYLKRTYGAAPVQAIRRVETPAGGSLFGKNSGDANDPVIWKPSQPSLRLAVPLAVFTRSSSVASRLSSASEGLSFKYK